MLQARHRDHRLKAVVMHLSVQAHHLLIQDPPIGANAGYISRFQPTSPGGGPRSREAVCGHPKPQRNFWILQNKLNSGVFVMPSRGPLLKLSRASPLWASKHHLDAGNGSARGFAYLLFARPGTEFLKMLSQCWL